jgi:hypothetical protein
MDLGTLVTRLRDEGQLRDLTNDRRVQFGTQTRRYLGATLLPERMVEENMYEETQVRYRTLVANSGSRYSPVQKKRGSLIGNFDVKLADSDIGDELTSRDHDALIKLLQSNRSMDAMASMLNWVDAALNRPLLEWNEKARWDAIVNAAVELRGNNKYEETVNYSNPAGHRANAAGTWSTDAYDPFDDIFAMATLMQDKGYTLGRIITSRTVLNIMAGNDKVRTRTGVVKVNAASGNFVVSGSRASWMQINGALAENGLPPIEIYDELYRTNTGTGRFLPNNVMVLIAATGRDELIDLGDASQNILLPNVLGYTAIGRAAGQSSAGRVIRTERYESKPPRIEGEGWQTSLPVILDPEAICVIKAIA